jgi:hypothetical protein
MDLLILTIGLVCGIGLFVALDRAHRRWIRRRTMRRIGKASRYRTRIIRGRWGR